MKRILASATGLILVMAVAGSAHLRTDRNWAAVQVPINVDGIRDVEMDGDLGDWDNVPSAFWVTHDDLVETVTGTQGDPDPGNLAERIIFGWSPVTNFLYVMEEKFDDFFYGTIDNNFDTLEVMLDFDHSADPIFQNVQSEGLDPERWEGALSQNYRYQLNKGAPNEMWIWGGAPWAGTEPHSGVRWSYEGELVGGPTTLYMEMWFTPFDDLPTNSTGPDDDRIIFHTIKEGEIMGVGFSVQDDDDGAEGRYNGYWTNSGDTEIYFKATAMVDYVFLGYNEDWWVPGEDKGTSVEEDSWARIKQSFSN